MRGWPWRWRAPRRRAARWCSTTAPVTALLREGGKVERRGRARRRERRRADGCARAASSTPPASGSTTCATWTATTGAPRQARPSSRRARACTSSSTAPSCPGTHALLVPKTARRPRAVRRALAGQDDPGHHRHAARRRRARARAVCRRGRLHPAARPARYLARAPTRADVRSVWVGLRPLVKPGGDDGDDTKALSREHTVLVGRSGLVTVTGGKWTTYRAMAEDVLERCIGRRLLPRAAGGVTERLPLLGARAARRAADASRRASTCTAARRRLLHALPGADTGCGAMPSPGQVRSARRWCALPRATRWRAASKTCWRGARGCCSSTPPRRRARPTPWPRSWPTSSDRASTPRPRRRLQGPGAQYQTLP